MPTNPTSKLPRKTLASMVLAGLAVLGVTGAAVAQTSPAAQTTPTAQTQSDTATSDASEATEANEAAEGPEANEAAEGPEADEASEAAEGPEADEATEGPEADEQEPSYTGSITAPDDDAASEADEAAQLQSLATITADQATAAATAAVPGDVIEVELDNENGSVVYSVEISDGNGGHIDVKVDAGNGAVLSQDADNDSEG